MQQTASPKHQNVNRAGRAGQEISAAVIQPRAFGSFRAFDDNGDCVYRVMLAQLGGVGACNTAALENTWCSFVRE